MIAEISGRPAASSDPKVTISTSAAKSTPSPSVHETPTSTCWNDLTAELDREAGIRQRRVVGLLHVGELVRRVTVLGSCR